MFRYTESGVLLMGESGSMPSTSPLLANLILRLVLGPLALIAAWVPLTLLWKNREFPACVFVANNWLVTLIVVINAAIWHNQDFDHWWLGYGWCDLQVYVLFSLSTIYSASICTIMRRLSQQVGLTRVTGLSGREKHIQLLVQILIIFPVPLLQIILTVFVQGQRYVLAPVNGCSKAFYGNAIYLVFFILPSPIFTIAACFHTYQTYRKFRKIDATTRLALDSGNNSIAASRSQRARRKLYLMAICILLPYAPLEAAFCAINIMIGWPWTSPSDFHYVHFTGAVPWNSINLSTYSDVSFSEMNLNWIPIVSCFVIFAIFGTSTEGINKYRETLVLLGAGHLFPRLCQEYDPDRTCIGDSQFSEGTQLTTLNGSINSSYKATKAPAQSCMPSEGDTAISNPPPLQTSSTWMCRLRGIFSKAPTSNASSAVDELELERNAAPFATSWSVLTSSTRPWNSSQSSSIFNPGLNWATPPNIPTLSIPSFLKPSASTSLPTIRSSLASPTRLANPLPRPPQTAHYREPPYFCHRPRTPPVFDELQAPVMTCAITPRSGDGGGGMKPVEPAPFDGNHNAETAVSTRVWSRDSTVAQLGMEVAALPPGKNTSSELGVVRVDRCIVSKVT